ncbi:MAG TPA: response regulator transcription factor [Vicinamibacterales bacterium]
MAHILIVEDDPDIADLIVHYLQGAGHSTTQLSSGSEVMNHLRQHPADLVILDVMLPGVDGMALCRAIRRDASTSDLPVIMLTARGEEADRIAGLELGADDYVTKPFSPRELVARAAARLRRREDGGSGTAEVLEYGPIRIDTASHTVTLDGEEVKLTAKEFLLLQYFVKHRGRVLSRDLLLTDVWGYHYTGGTRTVDVHIRRLREKLPVLNEAIETVKQFGYKLI